ncbi:MAG: hypothetical protein M5R40_22300 [Anaerolineae bacterium]|nr:hypothetical protein [Anaerolineae bacterium]
MTAEELVNLLTIPMEERAASVEGVSNVQSTTGGGFSFLQLSSEFGINQEALRDAIREGNGAVWAESGLARLWDSVDVRKLRTTADLTPAAIEEASARWPFLFDDLTASHLHSLSPEAAGALPDDFIDGLPAATRAAVIDIAEGRQAPAPAVALPQSWTGIARTSDLTPETVARILDVAPTMVDHFRNNGGELVESYLFAMSPDVIQALPAELTAGMGACSRQQLDAVIAGKASPDPATDLPSGWRASPPQLITFSFADLPLAFISISGDFTQAELRNLVEDEIVPRLESVEGVAEITVQGGQVLPGESDFTEVAAAEDNSAPDNPGEGGGTPIATPFWKLIGGR